MSLERWDKSRLRIKKWAKRVHYSWTWKRTSAWRKCRWITWSSNKFWQANWLSKINLRRQSGRKDSTYAKKWCSAAIFSGRFTRSPSTLANGRKDTSSWTARAYFLTSQQAKKRITPFSFKDSRLSICGRDLIWLITIWL